MKLPQWSPPNPACDDCKGSEENLADGETINDFAGKIVNSEKDSSGGEIENCEKEVIAAKDNIVNEKDEDTKKSNSQDNAIANKFEVFLENFKRG